MTKKPLPSPKSSNAQVGEYERAVRKGMAAQHVVSTNKGWAVKKVGSQKATGVFTTQKSAVEAARNLAIKQRTEVFVHGRDGRIRERNSYGNDPFPPKG